MVSGTPPLDYATVHASEDRVVIEARDKQDVVIFESTHRGSWFETRDDSAPQEGLQAKFEAIAAMHRRLVALLGFEVNAEGFRGRRTSSCLRRSGPCLRPCGSARPTSRPRRAGAAFLAPDALDAFRLSHDIVHLPPVGRFREHLKCAACGLLSDVLADGSEIDAASDGNYAAIRRVE